MVLKEPNIKTPDLGFTRRVSVVLIKHILITVYQTMQVLPSSKFILYTKTFFMKESTRLEAIIQISFQDSESVEAFL